MKSILIYRDYGQWIESPIYIHDWLTSYFHNEIIQKRLSILYTDASEICAHALTDNVIALFMPGAHARGYSAKLNGIGNAHIRAFVQNGGLYYGFCGGAYYAAVQTEFIGENIHLTNNDELQFFDGIAYGSIKEFSYNGTTHFNEYITSANAITIQLQDETLCAVYYHGGPLFIPYKNSEHSYTVLARYIHPATKKLASDIALIAVPVGNGQAILSALHPEHIHAFLTNQITYNNSYAQHIYAHITQTIMNSYIASHTQKLENMLLSYCVDKIYKNL